MINKYRAFCAKIFFSVMLLTGVLLFSTQPVFAQQSQSDQTIKPLRSDVGINGLTANFHWLSDYHYLGNDTLQNDGSSELEFVFHDIRMISPRLGVGFQALASFFINDSGDGSSFGIGSWGIGPSVRAYPFKNLNRFQPYLQANALFGNNMALGKLANTKEGGNGFSVRLGLRGGFAYRITNRFGLFLDGGPDWGSPRLFRAEARAWQLNIGVDVYRFN